MAFFLLGRVDDTLTLLCTDTFASRQDAMGALSAITSEPGFDLWDAEVLLLDTDLGTPVLLMRPTAATEPVVVPVQEPAVDMDVELGVFVSDDFEEPLETVLVEEPLPESVSAAEPMVIDDEFGSHVEAAPDREPVLEPPAQADAGGSTRQTVGDPAIADAIVEEFAAETVEDEQPDATSLRDALARTTAQMESEGIVAPESITAPPQVDVAQDSAWPWHTAVEVPVEPSVNTNDFVLSDIEEPSLDDRSILSATIDDEMFASARPVIMGTYTEPLAEIDSLSEPMTSLIDDLVIEPMGIASPVHAARSEFAVPVVADAGDIFPVEPPAVVEPPLESVETAPAVPSETSELSSATDVEPASDVDDSRDISDFILDLGPASEAEVEAPAISGLDDYTCTDCVYEETCPNKDQRLPKDCGSFQWR